MTMAERSAGVRVLTSAVASFVLLWALHGVQTEELPDASCGDLGFTGLALCSDCDSLAEYVKDKGWVEEQSVMGNEVIKKYSQVYWDPTCTCSRNRKGCFQVSPSGFLFEVAQIVPGGIMALSCQHDRKGGGELEFSPGRLICNWFEGKFRFDGQADDEVMKMVCECSSVIVSLILDGIAELETDCRKCCAEESENALSKMKYSGAVLEICMRKVMFYPNIQTFIDDKLGEFPEVDVKYRFGAPPKLIMKDDKGNLKDSIRIDNWKTEQIEQFLSEKVTLNARL